MDASKIVLLKLPFFGILTFKITVTKEKIFLFLKIKQKNVKSQ
jgi:hypothetical protein